MKKIAVLALSTLALVGCDESTDSNAVTTNCIAQKHTPSDPNLPSPNKEWFDIYQTSSAMPAQSVVVPSQYCYSQSGYSTPTVTFEVSNADVFSLRYDSGTNNNGESHQIISSDPGNEQDDLVYDVKYKGSDAPGASSIQLSTDISGGYFYSVYETIGDTTSKIFETSEIEDIKTNYPYLVTNTGVLNTKEISQLKHDYLDF
ncbi:hypothetical protein ACE1OE_22865 [Vibrio sp. E150_011]